MAFTEIFINQIMPTGTEIAGLYSGTSTQAIIKVINVCNVTSVPQTFSIYYNPAGSTYGVGNSMHYSQTIVGNQTVLIEGFTVLQSGAYAAVQCDASTGNRLVFTAFGATL